MDWSLVIQVLALVWFVNSLPDLVSESVRQGIVNANRSTRSTRDQGGDE